MENRKIQNNKKYTFDNMGYFSHSGIMLKKQFHEVVILSNLKKVFTLKIPLFTLLKVITSKSLRN